mmetsp:Transcript_16100/g.53971  ORF Transcript_16100/g.53971 Transcript_16100/m.53971 type:complete len:93 (+) Transcript_16100:192-470(+)
MIEAHRVSLLNQIECDEASSKQECLDVTATNQNQTPSPPKPYRRLTLSTISSLNKTLHLHAKQDTSRALYNRLVGAELQAEFELFKRCTSAP